MKEFNVYHALDSAVTWETIVKKPIIETKDVLKEVFKGIEHSNYYTVKNNKGERIIKASLLC